MTDTASSPWDISLVKIIDDVVIGAMRKKY